MPRKKIKHSSSGDTHPYLRGLRFWGEIASPKYSKKAKIEFMASKKRLNESNSLASIDISLR